MKSCFEMKLRRSDLSIETIGQAIRSSVGATSESKGRSYGATGNIHYALTIDRSPLTGLPKHALEMLFTAETHRTQGLRIASLFSAPPLLSLR